VPERDTRLSSTLDHLKKVNDTFGHDAGDYVLHEMSRRIRGEPLAPRHTFARHGGEQFAILLTNTGASHALDLAEPVRTRGAVARFRLRGREAAITRNIGVATWQP
jgi:diguanylate cyclase